jgi:O-methyltransferase
MATNLYESTIQALDALYPRLPPGGVCIIDDYVNDDCMVKPCRQAATDYRPKHALAAETLT